MDVLEGAGLIVNGVPRSVAELRACKPSKRTVQLSHATSARLHAKQIHTWHNDKAATRIHNACVFWDEGTGAQGTSALLTGVLGFIDGYRDQPYQDMLGLEVLPSKLGSAAAAGILRILQRRGITVVYHFMSDACTTKEQELPLKDCKAASGLHAHIQQHFSAMFMHNAWMEELVKHWKHLSGQARAHPDTAEEHMPLHMSMHMSIHMPVDMPMHMSIHMSVHMSIHMSTC